MELAFLPATEQARLVREREVTPSSSSSSTSSGSSGSTPSSARTSRSAARRRSPKRARRRSTAEAPFHGVPISLKDLDTTAGIRTTFSCPAFAANVPDFDLAHVASSGRRLRHPRQDEHARVRNDGVNRLGAERALPNALGSRAESRRVERRRRGRARGRAGRDLAGLGRRRLAPDPWLLLRRLRLQGLARSRLERAVRPGIGLGTTGPLARSTDDAAAPRPCRGSGGAIRARRQRPSGPSAEESDSSPAGCA